MLHDGGDASLTRVVRLAQRQGSAAGWAQPLERLAPGTEVRNVVLLIGDGLGFSQIQAARADLVGLDERLYFEQMPFTGWLSTHSWRSAITDSAASATALASGHKTLNGRVGVDSQGRHLQSVLEAARDRGMATGLVTSSYLVDATPAAFVSHVVSRRDSAEIARQMARSGVDLLLGEVDDDLNSEQLRQQLGEFATGGYAVHQDWDSLQGSVDSGPLLGLFESGSVADPDQQPTLAAATKFALERLASSPSGFFLMIEDEETDTGGHRLDWPRVRRGVANLEACAELAITAARADGHTLVLFTADHETGHFGIHSGGQGQPLGIRFDSTHHTGGPVPLYAYGAGAERFTGALDNTDIAWLMAELLGLQLALPEAGGTH